MNLTFINPFLKSASNVLGMMASIPAQRGEIHIASESLPDSDISGVVDIRCDSAIGVLAVSFSNGLLQALEKNMLGEQSDNADNNWSDLAGEVTNMIYGGAKAELESTGYDFDMAIPTIVEELDCTIDFPSGCAIVVIPLLTEYGTLNIQIAYENFLHE